MGFEERMRVASLVLEYLRVVLGYPVTIPLLVAFLCYLFRVRIGRLFDRLESASYGKASVKLANWDRDVTRATEATTAQDATEGAARDAITTDAIASFFGLAARLLPFLPKAERRPYIDRAAVTLPPEFHRFRAALYELADRAPEVVTRRESDSSGTDEWVHAGE
jgi:hypothetical protein